MVQGRSARQTAHQAARDILSEPLVIFDTETTGLGGNAEIVEIACIDGDGELLFTSLVRPAHPIPRDATNVHSITDADVQDAPTIVDLMPRLQEIWQQANRGNRVFAYNLDYDARLLVQSSRRGDSGGHFRTGLKTTSCSSTLNTTAPGATGTAVSPGSHWPGLLTSAI